MLVHVVLTTLQGKDKPDFFDFSPMSIKTLARRPMLSLARILNFVPLMGSDTAKVVGEVQLPTQ